MTSGRRIHLQVYETFLGAWALLGLFVLILTAQPTIFGNGQIRYQQLQDLIAGRTLAEYKYSSIQSIAAAPLELFARQFGLLPGPVVAHFNVLLIVVTFPFLWILLARRWGRRAASGTVLVLVCGSMLTHHVTQFYSEILTSLALVFGFLLYRYSRLASAAPIGLAVANTPVMVFPLLAGTLVWFISRRDARVISLPLVGGIAAFVENATRIGFTTSPYLAQTERGFSTLMPYSGSPGFSYPPFFGVLSVVASFGKGLIFFIPGLGLLLFRTVRRQLGFSAATWQAGLAFTITLVLLYGSWWAWYGGWFWGPRFFLVLVYPASLALGWVCTRRQFSTGVSLFVIGVLTLSTWVGTNGYIFGQRDLDICFRDDYALEALCWYTPEFSALWRPFVTGSVSAILETERSLYLLWSVVAYLLLAAQPLAALFTTAHRNLMARYLRGSLRASQLAPIRHKPRSSGSVDSVSHDVGADPP